MQFCLSQDFRQCCQLIIICITIPIRPFVNILCYSCIGDCSTEGSLSANVIPSYLEKFQVCDFTDPVLPTVAVFVEYVLVFSI